jgi:hypothetical protein
MMSILKNSCPTATLRDETGREFLETMRREEVGMNHKARDKKNRGGLAQSPSAMMSATAKNKKAIRYGV